LQGALSAAVWLHQAAAIYAHAHAYRRSTPLMRWCTSTCTVTGAPTGAATRAMSCGRCACGRWSRALGWLGWVGSLFCDQSIDPFHHVCPRPRPHPHRHLPPL